MEALLNKKIFQISYFDYDEQLTIRGAKSLLLGSYGIDDIADSINRAVATGVRKDNVYPGSEIKIATFVLNLHPA